MQDIKINEVDTIDNRIKSVDSVINDWCGVISEDIAERRFYDKAEVKAYASVKLKEAVHSIIDLQTVDLEKERADLAARYARPSQPTHILENIKRLLSEVNFKIKQRNRFLALMEDNSEYKALKKYVNNRFGQDAMNDFYNKINNNEDF